MSRICSVIAAAAWANENECSLAKSKEQGRELNREGQRAEKKKQQNIKV
jgi:hypothetical protein